MTQKHVVRAASVAGVLVVVVMAQIGLVLAPSQLGEHPLIVLALRPTPAFLMLVGGAVAPVTAVAVAAVGRTTIDMAYFAVARHGALPLVWRFGVGQTVARSMSRDTTARGLLTVAFFWSSSPVVAAIGLGRTPARRFLAVTGLGNVATSAVFVFLGRRLSDALVPVTTWVSARGVQLTVVLAGAVVVAAVLTYRRNRPVTPAGARTRRSDPPTAQADPRA